MHRAGTFTGNGLRRIALTGLGALLPAESQSAPWGSDHFAAGDFLPFRLVEARVVPTRVTAARVAAARVAAARVARPRALFLSVTFLIDSRSPGLSDSTSLTNLATSNLMLFSREVVIDVSFTCGHYGPAMASTHELFPHAGRRPGPLRF
jgi:hypothetical protein